MLTANQARFNSLLRYELDLALSLIEMHSKWGDRSFQFDTSSLKADSLYHLKFRLSAMGYCCKEDTRIIKKWRLFRKHALIIKPCLTISW